jgi:hypothetical protein
MQSAFGAASKNQKVRLALLFRDAVNSAALERVTPGQTFDAEPAAADEPVTFDRLVHVFRACGIETAGGWQEGRHHYFIYAEESAEGSGRELKDSVLELRKRNSFWISSWSAGKERDSDDRRGLMTTDHDGLN